MQTKPVWEAEVALPDHQDFCYQYGVPVKKVNTYIHVTYITLVAAAAVD